MTDEIRKRLDEYGAAERDRGAGDGRWIRRRDATRTALETAIDAELERRVLGQCWCQPGDPPAVCPAHKAESADARVQALEGALTDALRALREPRMWETRVHVAQGILNAALAEGKENT